MNEKMTIRLLASGIVVFAICVVLYMGWKHLTHESGIMDDSQLSIASIETDTPAGYEDWDPWDDSWQAPLAASTSTPDYFSTLQQRVDAVMNQMLPGSAIFSPRGLGLSAAAPSVDMSETEEAYLVEVTIPEGQEVKLNTGLANGVLTISGKVKSTIENASGNSHTKRFSSSQFSRSLVLEQPVDEAGMLVEYEQDKYLVRVPKV